jgi:hypothetical protein
MASSSWSDGLASDASLPALLLAAVSALSKLATSNKKTLHKLIRAECANITKHIMEQHKINQELIRSVTTPTSPTSPRWLTHPHTV